MDEATVQKAVTSASAKRGATADFRTTEESTESSEIPSPAIGVDFCTCPVMDALTAGGP